MKTLHVTERRAWRAWLKANGSREKEVWLLFYKKHTGKARLAYDDAIEEALCFGWIDSTIKRLDDERYAQKFTPRRRGSNWSELNIARAKKMIAAGLMTLILLVSAREIGAQENQGGPVKKREQKNVVPFVLSQNKTILTVTVGGSRPLKVILDSGMGWDGLLVFKPELKDSLRMVDPREMNLGGAGKGNGQAAWVSDAMCFSLGDMEFSGQRVVVLQNDHYKGFPNDGVLGYSIFGHFAVEIDYDQSLLTLHEPGTFRADPSWTEVPIFFRDNNIPWMNVRIQVENEEPVAVSCYIDYASSEAVELLLKPGQKFTLPRALEEEYLGRGLSGDITGKRGRVAKVCFGPYEIKNVQATFAAAEVRSKQRDADGVIANNLLRRFNLIFDYTGKKLYLKPNAHINEPF